MSRRVFDYNGITSIEIEGSTNLLERIARNVEGEMAETDFVNPDCRIKINESDTLAEIEKDKRYDYLTVSNIGTPDRPSIKYTRYNTPVRTIHHKSDREYIVDINVKLDEAAGLICLRNYLSNNQQLSSFPLLHASLLSVDGRGVLISGDSRQGKTTLAVYLLQEQKADYVSDENVILDTDGETAKGLYVPRTPRVRFSTIANSKLSEVLRDVDVERTDATQYIDRDAIEMIIATKSFHVDAGLAFSRQSFCDLLKVNSKESAPINTIIFSKYIEEGFNVKTIPFEKGIDQLSKFGLKRKRHIDPRELEETRVDLPITNLKGVDFIEVEFSDFNSIARGGFRL